MAASSVDQFVSKFCQWAPKGHLPVASYRRFPSALRTAVLNELPTRDGSHILVVREIVGANGLRCQWQSDTSMVVPTPSGQLLAGVLMPEWRDGGIGASKDKAVNELICDFFHFASQYVARSRIASILGALALVYGRGCAFIPGSMLSRPIAANPSQQRDFLRAAAELMDAMSERRFVSWDRFTDNGDLSQNSRQELRDYLGKNKVSNSRQRLFRYYVEAINGLDPFVHRAIYQYTRSLRLYEHGFTDDAISALDGVCDVTRQFVQQRMNGPADDPQRLAICTALDMPKHQQTVLDRLYRLRSYFGAHPSPSKWWDFAEMYEYEVEESFDAVSSLLCRLIRAEEAQRIVEKEPQRWSAWFKDNCMVVWNAVWFDNIPE